MKALMLLLAVVHLMAQGKYIHVCAYMCMYVHMYVCTCAHACGYEHVCVCLHAYALAQVYVCVSVCVQSYY